MCQEKWKELFFPCCCPLGVGNDKEERNFMMNNWWWKCGSRMHSRTQIRKAKSARHLTSDTEEVNSPKIELSCLFSIYSSSSVFPTAEVLPAKIRIYVWCIINRETFHGCTLDSRDQTTWKDKLNTPYSEPGNKSVMHDLWSSQYKYFVDSGLLVLFYKYRYRTR